MESIFATVRLRTKVAKGAGSRTGGLAMVFKLVESAQARWRAVNGAHLGPRGGPRTTRRGLRLRSARVGPSRPRCCRSASISSTKRSQRQEAMSFGAAGQRVGRAGEWPRDLPAWCGSVTHARSAYSGRWWATSSGEGYTGDLLGDRAGRGAVACVSVRQQLPDGFGDSVRTQFIEEQGQSGARGADGIGVGELVGPLGQDQLRGADGERAECGAAATVVHDHIDVRQQLRLWHPGLHGDVVRPCQFRFRSSAYTS
jgi:hypothetical protein